MLANLYIQVYIQLYSPRMVENKMKKERKKEKQNNMYRIEKQESLADAKVSARQQCVYEDP